MMTLLKNLLLSERVRETPAPGSVAPIGNDRGGATLVLADDVKVTRIVTATGEERFVLTRAGTGEAYEISANQHAVIQQLDGTRTVSEAIARNLVEGRFPAAIQPVLLDLVQRGLIVDPSGAWTDRDSTEETLDRVRRGWRAAFQRLESNSPAADRVLERAGRRLSPVAAALATPAGLLAGALGFALGSAALLYDLGARRHLLIPPEAAVLPHLLAMALVLYLCLNLDRLIRGAAACAEDPGCRGLSVGVIAGIPMVRVDEQPLARLQWQNAARIRFAGLAGMALIGSAPGILLLFADPVAGGAGRLALTGVGIYLFLALSPWWDSPVLRSIAQAFPGTRQPWDCWSFLWNRVLGAAPTVSFHGQGRGLLYAYAVSMVVWAAMLLRLGAHLLRTQILPLLGRALQADSAIGLSVVWILVLGTALVFFLGLTLVAVLLVQRFGALLPGRLLIAHGVHPGVSWATGGLALVSLAYLLPPDTSYLLLTGACAVGVAIIVRRAVGEFSPENRTQLSPVVAVLIAWMGGVTMFRLGAIVAQAMDVIPVFRSHEAGLLWVPVAMAYALLVRRSFAEGEGSPLRMLLLSLAGAVALASLEVTAGMVLVLMAPAVLLLGAWALTLPRCLYFEFLAFAAGSAGLAWIALLKAGGLASGAASPDSAPPMFDLEALAVFMASGAVALFCSGRRMPSPVEGAEEVSPDDRVTLARGAGRLFQSLQSLATAIDGGRGAAGIRAEASRRPRLFNLEGDRFVMRRGESVSLTDLGDEIAALFERALPVWFGIGGRRAARLCFREAYLALAWPTRQLFDENILRRSSWARELAPPLLGEEPLDPRRVLATSPTFARLPGETLDALASGLRLEVHAPGQTLVRQGETGESMFFIVRGSAEVLVETWTGDQQRLTVLREGTSFGQIALFYDSPRTATVRAASELWTYRLERRLLNRVAPISGRTSTAPLEEWVRRINHLYQVPLFRELSHYDLERLAEDTEEMQLAEGEVLMREGDQGDDICIISEGELEVTQQGEVVARRGPDEYVGEIALLFSIPRIATVTAARPSRLIRISGETFRRMATQEGVFQSSLRQVAQRRMAAGA